MDISIAMAGAMLIGAGVAWFTYMYIKLKDV
jgi:hypothetical protein